MNIRTTLAFMFLITSRSIASDLPSTVMITSGEHKDFTRFVLYSDPSIELNLYSNSTEVVILSNNIEANFDTAKAFEQIPRKRAATITPFAAGIKIELNCECPISHFSLSETIFVVDIHDPNNEGINNPALEIPNQLENHETKAIGFGEITYFRSRPTLSPNQNLDVTNDIEAALNPLMDRLPISISAAASKTSSLRATLDQSINASISPNLHLRVGKAVAKTDTEFENPPRLDASCAEYSEFPFTLTDNDHIGRSLKKTTEMALDFFLQPDPSVERFTFFTDLLYWGLGAEAKSILERLDSPTFASSKKRSAVKFIADIVEGPGVVSFDTSLPFDHCPETSQLWGILGGNLDKAALQSDAGRMALLRDISALPDHLRNRLAPAVVAQLSEHGLVELSGSVSNLSMTNGGLDNVGDVKGHKPNATFNDGTNYSQAVSEAHRWRKMVEQNITPSEHDFLEAETFIQLFTSTEAAEDLFQSYSELSAEELRYSQYFSFFDSISRKHSSSGLALAGFAGIIVQSVDQFTPDAKLVELALSLPAQSSGVLDGVDLSYVAHRLNSLELHDLASLIQPDVSTSH